MLALKQKEEQHSVVKQLLKELKKTEKKVINSKVLNKYDKDKTLSYIQNITQSSIKRTVASKKVENVSTEIICKKIVFYRKQYEIYSSYFEKLKSLNTASTKNYRTELNIFVRHLYKKTKYLYAELGGKLR